MNNEILKKEIIQKIEEYRYLVDYQAMGTEILLLSLMSIEDTMTNLILRQLNIELDDLEKVINNCIFIRENTKYTKTLEDVLAYADKLQNENEYLLDEAYLYSILEHKNCSALEVLSHFQIAGNEIKEELQNALDILEEDDRLLINLTKKAKFKELNKFIGRKHYIKNIDLVLSKKQKNNCMLIGPAGVGKSGIVEGLAYYYLKNNPRYTIYQLDLGNLIAGTRYRGDLEEKLMNVLDMIAGDNNIIFIDEIHNILNNSNNENSIDIGNLLKPFLARNTLKCIGATTMDEYYKTIAKDKALARRFKNIIVSEPSLMETYNILNGIKKDFEQFYHIKYSKEDLRQIIKASQYYPSLYNPDKAIDIFDEFGAYKKKMGNYKTIKDIVFNNLGIDYHKSLRLLKQSCLDTMIKEKIIKYFNLEGEKYILKANIDNINIIKNLQEIFNLDSSSLLTIDINDYNSEHLISTLLGTSPGYVGYEDNGILFKHINEHYISIIVFKNFHPTDYLYKRLINKILETGVIQDYQGRNINFFNTILLFMDQSNKKIGF